MTIQAIETTYRNVRFRSRSEARWAVFFDALGVKWHYEHEGYETPQGRYLPDFWLPDACMRGSRGGVLFEVKPDGHEHIHEQLAAVAEALGVHAILAVGFFFDRGMWDELFQIASWWDCNMAIFKCRCGTVNFVFGDYSQYECGVCKGEDFDNSEARVQAAYNHALQYRFW